MNSGKISYSPDYKSPLGRALGVIWQNPRLLERNRLESAVIEASLRLRRSTLALKKYFDDEDGNALPDAMEIYALSGEDVKARAAFDATTDALLAFESELEKKS